MNTVIYNGEGARMEPCVATVGFFDGVHRGHQFLIKDVIGEAREAGLQSTVITFDTHPRKVLDSDYIPELLSTPESKLLMLSKTNVDNCVVLRFDKQMAALSAREFMKEVLHDKLNVRKLIIGYDNRFGHDGSGDFEDYVKYGSEIGIDVTRGAAFVVNGMNVSSSLIRKYIYQGEIEMANRCLGYPYFITGNVINGYHRGRKLGFPTANLDTRTLTQMVPAGGVYAVKARVLPSLEGKRAMMDIGVRPTFEDDKTSLEVNIFNFSGDIYGRDLRVEFIHKMREDVKFDSVEALKRQLREDERMVNEQFDKEMEI